MACWPILLGRSIVATPQERVCSGAVLLEWVMFFESLNFEPVAVVLLRALHPLGKVFWGILEDTGVGKGALQPLHEHPERTWLVQFQSGMVGEILEFRDILIKLSFLHTKLQKILVSSVQVGVIHEWVFEFANGNLPNVKPKGNTFFAITDLLKPDRSLVSPIDSFALAQA